VNACQRVSQIAEFELVGNLEGGSPMVSRAS
jgi:hypothetical protein